ncbi:fructoselysine 6-kinase [Anaerocolumna sp. MB42-C2]|uniref:fructoselysine 6-kinase n=1 Tax=Anaerocolumna sp. MB42-C2 TaxID=3070997 RepID=UPI0027DFC0C9|nr:fructoselysine 6-kinase [Anaerocolumna sp. MB42-C2]WMJ89489.1 fructoselysine 6-kinase [Anaerocolumna sp. MB42-C2]
MEKDMNKERIQNIKAIGVGFSCVDVYEKLNKFYPTGNGVDWGIHLKRLGVPVSILSVVGTDTYGEKMREALKKEEIDISHLHTAEGETCKMMMDLINGVDRVHLEAIDGVMLDFKLTEEDKEYIKTFQFMHTDLFGNVLNDLAEIRAAGVKVVMDFSTFCDDKQYNTEENYKNVDYAFLSYDKEDEYIKNLLRKISSYGVKIVTATLGENGSISYDGENFYRHGIVPVKVVNTVGAGDSYIAGFTYGIIMGWDIPACMEFGAQTSAEVVTKFKPY